MLSILSYFYFLICCRYLYLFLVLYRDLGYYFFFVENVFFFTVIEVAVGDHEIDTTTLAMAVEQRRRQDLNPNVEEIPKEENGVLIKTIFKLIYK